MLSGVLIIDKPQGLTSHDVVAVARRCLRERRIGHTGTLDPLATGVLPLACGRATRLVRFLTASDKDYEATITFGVTTDTYDVAGTETSRTEARPTREQVEVALVALRGEYLQTPPPFSAKKVGGERAYALARAARPVALAPVPVRVTRADLTGWTGASATVALTCSAGFYVRSFAQALGESVGTGACLEALRRTRSGSFTLADSVSLETLQTEGPACVRRMVPLARLLPEMPAVRLAAGGREHVAHGRCVAGQAVGAAAPPATGDWVRLLDADDTLLALGTRQPDGSLHPSVVLI